MSPSNTGSASASASAGNGGGKNYIEHRVSKMDTLAGVAIKYGVEVADIKRMNGLATDLQMFALKTLKIPLPGRHPPSPTLSSAASLPPAAPGENSNEWSTTGLGPSNTLLPFRSVGSKTPKDKVTTAMSTLQKYYGLKPPNPRGTSGEGTEMAVYRSRSSEDLDDGFLSKASPFSDSQSQHNMTRRYSVGHLADNGAMADYMQFADSIDGESDKSVRRRQKSEGENGNVTPERILKGESSGGSSGFSASTGKGLAMRPKSASRAVLQSDSDVGWLNSIPVGLGNSIMTTDEVAVVHKSSSTPSLKDEESNNSTASSAWPTSRWSLKTDLQALSSAASITRPIFDGLPKPITGRWKTALD